MFERDLRLPDEGAMCIDSNLQSAKNMIIYLMKRVNKGINTWWKYNITTPRKEKLKLWEQGSRPDVTGSKYPPHEVDPLTGEPTPLEGMEILERMRKHEKYQIHVKEESRKWGLDEGGGRCVLGGPFFSMAEIGKNWQIIKQQCMLNKILLNKK